MHIHDDVTAGWAIAERRYPGDRMRSAISRIGAPQNQLLLGRRLPSGRLAKSE
jgi:hypothetical protein